MLVEPGQGGHIQRLETSFKNANYEKDDLFVMYDNKFVRDVIGSRMVSTILSIRRLILSHTSNKISAFMRR